MRARTIQNVFVGRLNIAEFLGVGGLLVVGFVLVAGGHGTIGGTTAAMLLFLRLFGPINQLLFVVDEMQSALASLGRIVGVLTAGETHESALSSDGETSSPDPLASGGVRISRVDHSYVAGHPVLTGIDLTLVPGERVAIVGASGAGKSTLAALVAGVHTAERGRVEAAGSVMLATQEVHVFDGTLRDNLTLVRPGTDDATLLDALARVGAQGLIARLPGGLDEPVGAAAAALTPAEAQQIALARVLLADPTIVILDEATAEAGSSDAGRLEGAAEAATRGRTALVVAHRLTQAATADWIVLMDRGRIVERGTHAELVAADGAYARLWEAWSVDRGPSGS
ncbi:ABC transporter family protein [Labedella gwakjiensis]|uniref:ABC transporter ATP-binding protein n=1 Tax=Labedella gwakjiensis TaxID=390269 RepID=A0A2P8GYQ8_9MICO|nr:ABC transporter ATP-binding protein [Labedella gwakjiensis]PSL39104.1 ABC transporter family protein [Labedella gwakjiensis]RUQ86451.1 ABC transporter ATP-binding protein [Labedella gwakjiensis]